MTRILQKIERKREVEGFMGEIVQISVIMGVYNPKDPERFFRAVRSIVSQTFSDWELILYDDGSEEPYRQTIRQAADMDKRIVLIRAGV